METHVACKHAKLDQELKKKTYTICSSLEVEIKTNKDLKYVSRKIQNLHYIYRVYNEVKKLKLHLHFANILTFDALPTTT